MFPNIDQAVQRIQQTVNRLQLRRSDDKSEITNEYGFIRFTETENESSNCLSLFIRLALETDAHRVMEFLRDGWDLNPPDLIISITGGGKRCRLSKYLRKTFQRGIVAAAQKTNAWLITAGTDAGVMREVGRALNNYRYKNNKQGLDIPCIGIASWEYTSGTDQLIQISKQTSSDINEYQEEILNTNQLVFRPQQQHLSLDMNAEKYIHSYTAVGGDPKRFDLERNHTHFLLFDGDSSDNDRLLLQRAAIERHVQRLNTTTTSTKDSLTPIVMVLVEGGPFSIRTICHALESNIPIVVVKGSGRAANLIADLYLCVSQFQTTIHKDRKTKCTLSSVTSSQWKELNMIFKNSMDGLDVEHMKENLMEKIFEYRYLINIFEFDSPRYHGNLEEAILEALFNAAKSTATGVEDQELLVTEFKLTMAWKKFDHAQEHILNEKTILKWSEKDLIEALFDALRRDLVDFVDLIVEYGTSFDKLTVRHLHELYRMTVGNESLPLKEKTKGTTSIRRDFLQDYFDDHPDFLTLSMSEDELLGKNAVRELFLWSIFVDRFEMGRYLCSKTWNSFMSALIGANIYRTATHLAINAENEKIYSENASIFDRDAKSIIDNCFISDESFSVTLLRTNMPMYDNLDPLNVADKASCRYFLASKAVQNHLDHQWKVSVCYDMNRSDLEIFYFRFGRIDHRSPAIYWKIFICTLMLPLFPCLSIFLPYVEKTRFNLFKQKHGIRWWKKMIYFYQAPMVRFLYNLIFFVIFLILFSYVLITGYFPWTNLKKEHIPEIVLHIFLWSLLIEECVQFFSEGCENYFRNPWNWFDCFSIILYLIAFSTRFIHHEHVFTLSRIVFGIDLISWFLGALRFFTAFERLGPKLFMIFNTMKDLMFFICFIMIFLCGFSVASWSLISAPTQFSWVYNDFGQLTNVTVHFGQNQSQSWRLLRDITNYGVWKIFGQIDPIVGDDPYSDVAFILAIVFVTIANVLLLNVLIALFNVTIQNVQEHAHELWRYQRFLVVNEYAKATPLPIPFNVFYYIFKSIRILVRRTKLYHARRKSRLRDKLLDGKDRSRFQPSMTWKVTNAMHRVHAIADEYWEQVVVVKKSSSNDSSLERIEEKLDKAISLGVADEKSHYLLRTDSIIHTTV